MKRFGQASAVMAVVLELAFVPAPAVAASGAKALEAIVGNTITGRPTSDSAEFFAYFAKDGTLKSMQNEKRDDGKWVFESGKLCLSGPNGSGATCFLLDVDGDRASLTSSDGTIKAKVLPGNPMKL